MTQWSNATPLSTSRTHFIIIFLSLSCNYMKTTDIINDVEDIMRNKAFLPVRTYLLPSDENLYCLRVAELFQLYSKWVRFHKGFI